MSKKTDSHLKVVQVIPDFDLGGIQKAGQVLANGLNDKGHSVWLIGRGKGPRFDHQTAGGPIYELVQDDSRCLALLTEISPDVIHIHGHLYDESLVRALANRKALHDALIVSTPVFGRPPDDRGILGQTCTCCVGIYCLYRLLRWLRMPARRAVFDGRFGYVPLTPFEPPVNMISAIEPPTEIQRRRQALGVPADHFVVGRIGLNNPTKWRRDTCDWIDAILTRVPNSCWMSIGLPYIEQKAKLSNKWGNRFVNFDETADYEFLCSVLASLDVQVFFSPHGECFASSICEPAGLAVPTIALSTPLGDNGQSEQVVDGVTGYLVGNLGDGIERLRQLAGDSGKLGRLKKTTQDHALRNWHREVAVCHLETLYEFWRNPSDPLPPFITQMQHEQQQFAAQYHDRLVALHGGTTIKDLWIRAQMAAIEYWPTFRLGRTVKWCFRGSSAPSF